MTSGDGELQRRFWTPSLSKKLNCPLENCGEQFVFEITEHALEKAKHNERHRYQGKCKRCGKILKLTSNGIGALGAGFGHPEFKVIETTFDDLFEAEKKI